MSITIHLQGSCTPARYSGTNERGDVYADSPSTLALAGSLMVLTTYASAGNSIETSRPILAADQTANYEDGSANKCGVLGVLMEEYYTDSNGAAINPIPESAYKSAIASTIKPVPSMGIIRRQRSFTYSSAVYTYSAALIVWATDEMEFWMRMYSSYTATELSIGDQVGINIAAGTGATSRTSEHTVTCDPTDTSPALLAVRGFHPSDDTIIRVAVLPDFQQFRTAFRYTAQ